MSEIKKDIAQARRFEFRRVHQYRDAEALYGKADASDEVAAVTLGRLCMKNRSFGLRKKRSDTLARLRRAAATSEPPSLRNFAIYVAYLNDGWNHESINLLDLATQKDDYLAGYIMSIVLDSSRADTMNCLSLPIADRKALYLDLLQRSAMLSCVGALWCFGCYYWDVAQVEEGTLILTHAAEGGCFGAFQVLSELCRSIGSVAHYGKRLACDENDVVTAGCLADYFAEEERGTLMDRVAALRFHRRSFRMGSSEHTYVVFADHRWDVSKSTSFARVLLFLRNDCLLSSKQTCFPIVRDSGMGPCGRPGERRVESLDA